MVSDKIKNMIENILFWAGIATIVLWALGKSIGIINSPNWVEMLPYFGIAVTISTASTKVGRTLEKINNIDKRVDNIDKRVSSLERRFSNLCIAVIRIGRDVKEIQRRAFCLNEAKCSAKRQA